MEDRHATAFCSFPPSSLCSYRIVCLHVDCEDVVPGLCDYTNASCCREVALCS